MRRKKRKLNLSRQTVRTLVNDELRNAQGGAFGAQTAWRCTSKNSTADGGFVCTNHLDFTGDI